MLMHGCGLHGQMSENHLASALEAPLFRFG
jgi:hypothetical protein